MADVRSTDAAPISSEFHSAHVERLMGAMEKLDVNDEQAKVEVEIECSKEHWSDLESAYYTAVEGPTMGSSSSSTSHPKWVHEEWTPEWEVEVAEDNVRVFRSLQENNRGGFFVDENDLGPDQQLPKWMIGSDGTPQRVEFGLSSQTPFAEGAQAQLFHAHDLDMDAGEKFEGWVMKVFKEGMSLRDLLRLFPWTMLANDDTCVEGSFGIKNNNCNPIFGARLLKSTRQFAFLMLRAWGDLRKLINERMRHFNNQGPPFPNDVALFIIHQIATGMQGLHAMDIIHRDLKAANVLVCGPLDGLTNLCCLLDPTQLKPYRFDCLVADYECSVGIVGTGFWRAPEILEAVKNRNIYEKPELFTKQADVFSFGMTCYEILSGRMPFEELLPNDYDSVIVGRKPMLPSQSTPWMVDLLNRCWDKDPSMRPPFGEIVQILEPYVPESEV